MGKYGWRRIAAGQGFETKVEWCDDDLWFGEISSELESYSGFWPSEAEVLEQLEAWWRAQVTA